eukprot:TRINITY_DN11145_c0_g1_i1.p1 TRINITY_DN11145_c0_g1~~TRINITY_DN11145_c0_g1_i1.p1  ORF type:complete len:159 (-),score=36.68 TRINITY_DN11145_c0_g1_i1:6-482(-)
MWDSNSGRSLSDIKELTPEFYYLPEFLLNLNNIPLGHLSGDRILVPDVTLPPWADQSPLQFVKKNMEALESPYVSDNIHLWIDLIFGYKQRGQPAVEAMNVYYKLVYEDLIDIGAISDPIAQKATEEQSMSFGSAAKQLFFSPHPMRNLKEYSKLINL